MLICSEKIFTTTMKKLLLTFVFIVFAQNFSEAQDNLLAVFPKEDNTESLLELSPFSEKMKLHKSTVIYPVEYIKTYDILGHTEYLRAYTHNGPIYVGLNNIDISDEQINSLINADANTNIRAIQSIIDEEKSEIQKEKEAMIEAQKQKKIEEELRLAEQRALEEKIRLEQEKLIKEETEKLIKEYDKKGIVITGKEYAYSYGGFFGLSVQFYNGSNKTIKYIDLTIRPYNRVGDLTRDEIGRDVNRIQIIGPAEAKTVFSFSSDELFYDPNDIIHTLVITYMKITYMDNTTRTITNISNHLGIDVYNGKGN